MTVARLFIARIMAGLIATLAGWLSTKWGIVLDADTQGQLAASIVTQLFVIFSIVYPILHKLFDSRINPGDAASVRLAKEESKRVSTIRASDG